MSSFKQGFESGEDPVAAIFSRPPKKRVAGDNTAIGKERFEISALPSRKSGQTNWEYHLINHDGENKLLVNMEDRTYQWQVPKDFNKLMDAPGMGGKDIKARRLTDVDRTYAKEMMENAKVLSKGRLQVHKSGPSNLHATIQNGKTNPTFDLSHSGSNSWKMVHKPSPRKPNPAQTLHDKATGMKTAFSKMANILSSVPPGAEPRHSSSMQEMMDITEGAGIERAHLMAGHGGGSQTGYMIYPRSRFDPSDEALKARAEGTRPLQDIMKYMKSKDDGKVPEVLASMSCNNQKCDIPLLARDVYGSDPALVVNAAPGHGATRTSTLNALQWGVKQERPWLFKKTKEFTAPSNKGNAKSIATLSPRIPAKVSLTAGGAVGGLGLGELLLHRINKGRRERGEEEMSTTNKNLVRGGSAAAGGATGFLANHLMDVIRRNRAMTESKALPYGGLESLITGGSKKGGMKTAFLGIGNKEVKSFKEIPEWQNGVYDALRDVEYTTGGGGTSPMAKTDYGELATFLEDAGRADPNIQALDRDRARNYFSMLLEDKYGPLVEDEPWYYADQARAGHPDIVRLEELRAGQSKKAGLKAALLDLGGDNDPMPDPGDWEQYDAYDEWLQRGQVLPGSGLEHGKYFSEDNVVEDLPWHKGLNLGQDLATKGYTNLRSNGGGDILMQGPDGKLYTWDHEMGAIMNGAYGPLTDREMGQLEAYEESPLPMTKAAGLKSYLSGVWKDVNKTLLEPAAKSVTDPNHVFRDPKPKPRMKAPAPKAPQPPVMAKTGSAPELPPQVISATEAQKAWGLRDGIIADIEHQPFMGKYRMGDESRQMVSNTVTDVTAGTRGPEAVMQMRHALSGKQPPLTASDNLFLPLYTPTGGNPLIGAGIAAGIGGLVGGGYHLLKERARKADAAMAGREYKPSGSGMKRMAIGAGVGGVTSLLSNYLMHKATGDGVPIPELGSNPFPSHTPSLKMGELRVGSQKEAQDNRSLIRLGLYAAIGGGALASVLASEHTGKKVEKLLKRTKKVDIKGAEKMLGDTGLAKDVPILSDPGSGNAAYLSARQARKSMDWPEMLGYAGADKETRAIMDKMMKNHTRKGVIVADPSHMREAIVLHEGGHAQIANGHALSPSRINQTYLRPVSNAVSEWAPAIAAVGSGYLAAPIADSLVTGDGAGSVVGRGAIRTLIGAALGGTIGAVAGGPTIINETQATGRAIKGLEGMSKRPEQLTNDRRALRAALHTYIGGAIAAPAAAGAISGLALSPMMKRGEDKTAAQFTIVDAVSMAGLGKMDAFGDNFLKNMVLMEPAIPYNDKVKLMNDINAAQRASSSPNIHPSEILGTGTGALTGFLIAKSRGYGPVATGVMTMAGGAAGRWLTHDRGPDPNAYNSGQPGFKMY